MGSRMRLKYKGGGKKERMGEKDFLFLLSESKFTHFQQKAHELLKQYLLISRNWEKFPLRRSFISVYMQPVAAENTACKASLCCKEILLLAAAAVTAGITSLPLPITSGLLISTNYCFITHCVMPVVPVLALAASSCWFSSVRKT